MSTVRLRQGVLFPLVFCLVLALTPAAWSQPSANQAADLKPTVILISIDGFRFDYLQKYRPGHLLALAREGVRARWMIPAFPSLTFPNHYTIVTGLYPEEHGIVSNDMFDPVLNESFNISKKEAVTDGRWWGGEPVWVTAEKQGQHAANYFWPGSEAEISGKRPSYFKTYDGKVPNLERVAGVLAWLDLPAEQRPTFISLYFSDVDSAGHDFGPNSREVADAIHTVDTSIGHLILGLRTRGIYDQVNIVVVSDHGMAPLRSRDVIVLDKKFQTERAERVVWNAEVTNIFPKTGETKNLLRQLSRQKLKHAQCYAKERVPARFHYRNNRRIAPIVCIADEGWRIFSRKRYEEDLRDGKFPNHLIGAHGFDNRLRSMRATFLARGPAFKRGVVVAPFTNLNVYLMMTRILGLTPAKNDGQPGVVRSVLRQGLERGSPVRTGERSP